MFLYFILGQVLIEKEYKIISVENELLEKGAICKRFSSRNAQFK